MTNYRIKHDMILTQWTSRKNQYSWLDYSLVSNNEWTDVTENGKYKSISTITKTDDCNLNLTLKSNTNPKFDSFLKVGAKMSITILGVDKKNPKIFYVLMTFNGMNIYQKIEKKA